MSLFSIEEANRLIPHIRPILIEISQLSDSLSHFQNSIDAASSAALSGGGGFAGGAKYVDLLYRMQQRAMEIHSLGIQIKDASRGLIDFPTEREGKLILLCWQIDDGDEVLWWHDFESGFSGRKPI